MGLYLGGRDLQWVAGRRPPALCVSGHWGNEPGREAAPGNRRRRARVHPELARSTVASESPGAQRAGGRGGRWGPGILGGIGGNLPEHAAATLLGAQDPQCVECSPQECAA